MHLHHRNEIITNHANQQLACGRSARRSRLLARSRRTDQPTSTRQSQEARQPGVLRDLGLVAYPAFLVALLNTITKTARCGNKQRRGELLKYLLLQGFNAARWSWGGWRRRWFARPIHAADPDYAPPAGCFPPLFRWKYLPRRTSVARRIAARERPVLWEAE